MTSPESAEEGAQPPYSPPPYPSPAGYPPPPGEQHAHAAAPLAGGGAGGWDPPSWGSPPPPPPSWHNDLVGAPLSAFGVPLAGWWQRVGSYLLDGLILAVPSAIISAVATAHWGRLHTVTTLTGTTTARSLSGHANAILVLVVIAIDTVYFGYFNGLGRGQTPGNRAPGIAVRDMSTGEPIGLGRGLLRFLVRLLLYLALIVPGIVNDLFPLWDSRRQTIADKAAKSVVIRLKIR